MLPLFAVVLALFLRTAMVPIANAVIGGTEELSWALVLRALAAGAVAVYLHQIGGGLQALPTPPAEPPTPE